jgi:AraC family transcriptional activator of pobA
MAKQVSQKDNIDVPFITDLTRFFQYVKAQPPLYHDFDVREVDFRTARSYDHRLNPVRHTFYGLTLLLEQQPLQKEDGHYPQQVKPTLYFTTPCQLRSWAKADLLVKEYFFVMTEEFILKNKFLADVVIHLPFSQYENDVPFEIEPEEVEWLTSLYARILQEYHSTHADKFSVIASCLHMLLTYVRRLYSKHTSTTGKLPGTFPRRDDSVVERFFGLVRKHTAARIDSKRPLTVKFLAAQLAIHPNHLNAVIKKATNKTAIEFVHDQIIQEARTLLVQTSLSIKQISFQLGYSNPAHFDNFFKKKMGVAPALYRKIHAP